ncbi:hypothetical protein B0H66DRAFT_465508 [Apodospora peruviana]|uniref:Uncharacterized protein n=1 Tax=Apodospora peruviana TaxID=516989 RepID=A0AAE0ISJ1_9PEZI|nr:hypothetical protein B0H66DRAFT_465508 [Apodospora peruviana]
MDHLLPWSFFEARATTLEPSGLLSLDCLDRDPLELELELQSPSPRTTLPGSFSLDDFTLQLPLFTNTNNANNAAPQDHSPYSTTANAICLVNSGINSTQLGAYTVLDNRFPLPYTFFLSPSTSTSSLVDSSLSYDSSSSCFSQDTLPTMPGQTLAVPADAAFAPTLRDYFASSTDATSDRLPLEPRDGNLQRPRSARSARSGRSTSPIFTRWARRHQHQQFDGSTRSSTESKPASNNSSTHKRSTRSRSGSLSKRYSQAGVVPQMTREEFEALPVAIQRKYFSTLERLRFAQDSGLVDGISRHYDDISHFRRRKSLRIQDRSVSEQLASRVRRRSLLESHLASPDSSLSYASLPDKIKRKEFTREEQVVLARRLRASVILDAADEAICKINRRASRNLHQASKSFSPSPSSQRASMESHDGRVSKPSDQLGLGSREVPQSFYDSFRWLDEEDDLDLRLFLDDYHANLRDDLPLPTKQQRPSFRRHLSISKIPFGRNSLSLSRPGTKDATSPISPAHSPAGSTSNPFGHPRRKSRALSLITPRHTPQDSITAFDPAAAHYQDPEARLKLRVYLGSPQKFDEAIEFGFPSADVLSATPANGRDSETSRRQSRHKHSEGALNMHTFLADDDDDDNDADDRLSLNSDHASMADPDSPKTPQAFDNKPGPRAVRPLRLVSTDPVHIGESGSNVLESGGYVQAPASSREMTLRMTLTRPDLRANDDQIYGWQQQTQGQQPVRKSTTVAPLSTENNVAYVGDAAYTESMERVAMGFDHWGPSPTDKGVMKRIWNRVRRA